jgi:hypothetical protein
LEDNVPGNFPIWKNFPLTVYLKPSGPTDYFEIPSKNHIATVKPRTYGLPICMMYDDAENAFW